MKIIRKDNELIGKTIAFAHMAQFAENITIATTDGYVIVITQDYDDETDETQTRILNDYGVVQYIENNDYLRNELGKLDIFDLESYKQKKKEERIRQLQEWEDKRLKEERELYEKLKVKFEND